MKTPKEWWREYVQWGEGESPRTFPDLLEAIRAEQREACVQAYADKCANWTQQGIDAIRSAGVQPSFVSGQLVRRRGEMHSLRVWLECDGKFPDLYEPVPDIHGNHVYLEAPDDR